MGDRLPPATWRESTYSNNQGACVEIAELPGSHLVRDSKLGDRSPILTVTPEAFAAFVQAVKDDQLG